LTAVFPVPITAFIQMAEKLMSIMATDTTLITGMPSRMKPGSWRIRPRNHSGKSWIGIESIRATARLSEATTPLTAAGADRIVSMDLHSAQIQGFTAKPFDHLTALPVFYQYLQESVGKDMVIVSPDPGRVRLASRFARHLDAGVAFVHKRRRAEVHNEVDALQVVGDVAGLHAVIIDDMIDTGGTVVAAAELLRQAGALSVRALATHGVLSPPAAERFADCALEEVVITNTLPVPPAAAGLSKLRVLSVGPILADALRAIFAEESVSALFMGENA